MDSNGRIRSQKRTKSLKASLSVILRFCKINQTLILPYKFLHSRDCLVGEREREYEGSKKKASK